MTDSSDDMPMMERSSELERAAIAQNPVAGVGEKGHRTVRCMCSLPLILEAQSCYVLERVSYVDHILDERAGLY